ncbi:MULTISPECIES: hypothetical protein [unclassified Nostoc]|uniref:hypothetical protein n=1 Tax=unclassified Nostoc TaxID=2593658 RepID=UPI002AD331A7|nr:hypothetical protein [Nostoc sp. DedQUE03]MDZ7973546.1 hypothetical protein [Nostoc sp. DedQUE03]MDZ8048094.1 hypothetical protein [Nostoc sp. DedQUE02]
MQLHIHLPQPNEALAIAVSVLDLNLCYDLERYILILKLIERKITLIVSMVYKSFYFAQIPQENPNSVRSELTDVSLVEIRCREVAANLNLNFTFYYFAETMQW